MQALESGNSESLINEAALTASTSLYSTTITNQSTQHGETWKMHPVTFMKKYVARPSWPDIRSGGRA